MSWYRLRANRWPGIRIRDLRVRMGWSQPDLARAVGALTGRSLRGNRVYRWERRGVRPEPVYQDALDAIDRMAPPEVPVAGVNPAMLGR